MSIRMKRTHPARGQCDPLDRRLLCLRLPWSDVVDDIPEVVEDLGDARATRSRRWSRTSAMSCNEISEVVVGPRRSRATRSRRWSRTSAIRVRRDLGGGRGALGSTGSRSPIDRMSIGDRYGRGTSCTTSRRGPNQDCPRVARAYFSELDASAPPLRRSIASCSPHRTRVARLTRFAFNGVAEPLVTLPHAPNRSIRH